MAAHEKVRAAREAEEAAAATRMAEDMRSMREAERLAAEARKAKQDALRVALEKQIMDGAGRAGGAVSKAEEALNRALVYRIEAAKRTRETGRQVLG